MISAAAPHPHNCLTTLVNEVIAAAGQTPAGKAAVPIAPEIPNNPNKKKVLFVTSELADLVKTGGLGDVSAALPRAMRHLHDVRVLIPGYPQVINSDNPIHIIGELGGHAALPACKIGRMVKPPPQPRQKAPRHRHPTPAPPRAQTRPRPHRPPPAHSNSSNRARPRAPRAAPPCRP